MSGFLFCVFHYFWSADFKYENDFILYALVFMKFEVLHFILLPLNKLLNPSWNQQGYQIFFISSVRFDHGYKETSLCKQPQRFLLYSWILHVYSSERQYNIVCEANLWRVLRTHSWRPRQEMIPTYCEEMLCDGTKWKGKGLPFGIPTTWREPKDHTTDCYFCLAIQMALVRKTDIKSLLSYQHFDLLCILMSYQFQFLVSCLHLKKRVSTKCKRLTILTDSDDPSYVTSKSSTPKQFSQTELNVIMHDLGLSKNAAEIFAS